MTTKLVLGCGYLGQRVARRWLAAGDHVVVLTRSAEHANELSREGFEPIVADVTQRATLHILPKAESVLYAIGYDPRCGITRQAVQIGGLENVLQTLPAETGRILYISSTGVYGNAGETFVDEESVCRPTREAGRLALAAEDILRRHPLGQRAVVLRLAGLYGPGRIPKIADLLAGKPLAVPAHGFLNLIHVDDAVAAVLAAEARAHPPRTYLISDGHPVARREFYRRLANLLNRTEPQFMEPSLDSSAAIRALDNKRIRNTRMLDELRVHLTYPTFSEGLAAIVRELRESMENRS